jgi:hypothetical protein
MPLYGLAGWVEQSATHHWSISARHQVAIARKVAPIADIRKTRRQTDQGTFETDYGSIFRWSHHPAICECTQ